LKKLVLAAIAVAVTAGFVFAGEMKVKLGLDTIGSATFIYKENAGFNYKGDNNFYIDSEVGVGMALEFLFPIFGIVKIGPGVGYSFERGLKLDGSMKLINDSYIGYDSYIDKQSYSFIPTYLTIEVNPIRSAPEVFFKGNIGVNYGTISTKGTTPAWGSFPAKTYSNSEYHLGFYYGFGAGYNFPSGFFLDALYSWNSLYEPEGYMTYSRLAISAGYKFKFSKSVS